MWYDSTVNFVGHAHTSRWQQHDPHFALGTMLPDFASMLGARPPHVGHEVVQAGVAHHHVIDQIFHHSPTFLNMMSRWRQELSDQGVPRGGARALAHVGIELFLDGELIQDNETETLYREALNQASKLSLVRTIEGGFWQQTQWAAMFTKLSSSNLPHRYRDPLFVAHRLFDILEGRSRLAIPTELHDVAITVLRAMQDDVRCQKQALLDDIQNHSPSARSALP
jgi:hypothetical protein